MKQAEVRVGEYYLIAVECESKFEMISINGEEDAFFMLKGNTFYSNHKLYRTTTLNTQDTDKVKMLIGNIRGLIFANLDIQSEYNANLAQLSKILKRYEIKKTEWS